MLSRRHQRERASALKRENNSEISHQAAPRLRYQVTDGSRITGSAAATWSRDRLPARWCTCGCVRAQARNARRQSDTSYMSAMTSRFIFILYTNIMLPDGRGIFGGFMTRATRIRMKFLCFWLETAAAEDLRKAFTCGLWFWFLYCCYCCVKLITRFIELVHKESVMMEQTVRVFLIKS